MSKVFLKKQRAIARELNIPFTKIEVSPLAGKKYRITLQDGSHVDYGAAGMDDYLIHQDDTRRVRFHMRFKDNPGYNDIRSPLYFSARLLW